MSWVGTAGPHILFWTRHSRLPPCGGVLVVGSVRLIRIRQGTKTLIRFVHRPVHIFTRSWPEKHGPHVVLSTRTLVQLLADVSMSSSPQSFTPSSPNFQLIPDKALKEYKKTRNNPSTHPLATEIRACDTLKPSSQCFKRKHTRSQTCGRSC